MIIIKKNNSKIILLEEQNYENIEEIVEEKEPEIQKGNEEELIEEFAKRNRYRR